MDIEKDLYSSTHYYNRKAINIGKQESLMEKL